ncbi:MAG: nucleotidyltransferase domain-containing protein [Planctomycetes bacterium]|nr:nucleotidyltransferase domain-containing protein [Planctomycetota bacterium]
MREAILRALEAIEAEHSVRVLYACEAGSRAWGFASPDSDYDVRFVYVHELDWYLRVRPGRDSLSRMLPGDLDLAGWELRKALSLFAGSNATLFEHLGSDIVYRDERNFAARLRELLPSFFDPIAAGHHYVGLASRIHGEHLQGGHVILKKLFYVLRPLAAFRWIELHGTMAPTRFDAVLRGIDLGTDRIGQVTELRRRKVALSEAGAVPLDPAIHAWIGEWLERSRAAARSLPRRGGDLAALDRLLAELVRG